ncbi:MAG: glycosyltransferase family 4 protein [Candidatus Heimdallarchaeota archaeon]
MFDHKPLLLDIDDWQFGFVKQRYENLSFLPRFRYLASSLTYFYDMYSYWNNLFCEKLVNIADQITVSNRFLQRKFGGEIVWHARDTKLFDPRKFDKNSIKMKYHIEKNQKIVMFLGTPNPHKGIEDLIKALTLIKIKNITLVIVGINTEDAYCKTLINKIKSSLPDRAKLFGLQPFEKVPEFLAMADVVVIPQRKNFASIGQLPAKVFDAMAMAKPIVATNVNDLPDVLDNCGWIVEPESPEQLAEAIEYILNNFEEAGKMGWKARQKCIQKYSWDAVEKILMSIFQKWGI